MLVMVLWGQAGTMYAEEPSKYLQSCFFLWSGCCRRTCMGSMRQQRGCVCVCPVVEQGFESAALCSLCLMVLAE